LEIEKSIRPTVLYLYGTIVTDTRLAFTLLGMRLFIILSTRAIAPVSAGEPKTEGASTIADFAGLRVQEKQTATQIKPQSGTPTTPGRTITSGKIAQ
jgi:hypothetical protein